MHMQRRIASVFHLNFKSTPRTLQWRHAGPCGSFCSRCNNKNGPSRTTGDGSIADKSVYDTRIHRHCIHVQRVKMWYIVFLIYKVETAYS